MKDKARHLGIAAICGIAGLCATPVDVGTTSLFLPLNGSMFAAPNPCAPEFAWEYVWRVGDLVMWDNRCTMHRRDAFDPNSRRIMHRTQVKGDERPV